MLLYPFHISLTKSFGLQTIYASVPVSHLQPYQVFRTSSIMNASVPVSHFRLINFQDHGSMQVNLTKNKSSLQHGYKSSISNVYGLGRVFNPGYIDLCRLTCHCSLSATVHHLAPFQFIQTIIKWKLPRPLISPHFGFKINNNNNNNNNNDCTKRYRQWRTGVRNGEVGRRRQRLMSDRYEREMKR